MVVAGFDTNGTGLQAIEGHRTLLDKKQKELAKFMSDYKIEVKSSDSDTQQAAQNNQGLLVS